MHDSCIAERSVLAAMLRWEGCLGDVLQIVQAKDFQQDAHQRIFSAIVRIYERGQPVDIVTATEELHRFGDIEDIKYSYLGELLEEAPSAANAEVHARIVRDQAICRELASAAQAIAHDAEHPIGSAEEVLEQAEKRIFGIIQSNVIGTVYTAREVSSETADRIDARFTKREIADGCATGFEDLDAIIGGLQPSEVVILGGRPGLGKTVAGVQVASHVAIDCGSPVFFVSLEQSRVELLERIVCARYSIDSHRLRRGTLGSEDLKRIAQGLDDLREVPLFIADSPDQTMQRITANARRLKLRHQIRLVVIDYLQLIRPDNPRDPRHEQVAQISRRLKCLAKELEIPVLALAQLGRSAEDRPDRRPRLIDLRESGSLEQDADVALLIHKPDSESNKVEILVAKNRHGPLGEVTLIHVPRFMRFENYTPLPPEGM